MRFETHREKLLGTRAYLKRQVRFTLVALGFLVFSLGLGVLGYHYSEGLSWLDSFLNAAMIMGGMGPVNEINSVSGKIFAGLYALYSGLGLLATVGIIAAPLLHRLFHIFHMDLPDSQ